MTCLMQRGGTSGERVEGPEVGQGGSTSTKPFSERKEGWGGREIFNSMKRARERVRPSCGKIERAQWHTVLRKKQKQGDGAGALELNDLDVQEWSVIWQELQCSQQRAIQQNKPYDIISQIVGEKKLFLTIQIMLHAWTPQCQTGGWGNMTLRREKMNRLLFIETKMRNHLLLVHLTEGICVPCRTIQREATVESWKQKHEQIHLNNVLSTLDLTCQ